jgi:outer membrane protein OmpA-like peptidoglycan-associated protein
MKLKSLLVLLLAGIWGVGSWWWYTCKIKGFCGADTTAAQVTTGVAATGAAALSGYGNNGGSDQQTSADQAAADKAKADADKAAADKAKADADQAAADKAKADADKAAADKAKADADKAAADKAKADADKAAADKAKADADKAAADKAAADKAKADADKADADKVTMETSGNVQGTDIGPVILHFPTGSANPQLADTTKSYFAKVAKFLEDNSSAKVTIVGHTDNKGDPAKNKALGLKRAEILQKALVDLGVPKDRVSASSEGADKPIADNSTEQGREKNRRVEITPVK